MLQGRHGSYFAIASGFFPSFASRAISAIACRYWLVVRALEAPVVVTSFAAASLSAVAAPGFSLRHRGQGRLCSHRGIGAFRDVDALDDFQPAHGCSDREPERFVIAFLRRS